MKPYAFAAPNPGPEPGRQVGEPSELHPGQRFNPHGRFNGILIPEALVKFKGLSLGAKITYGRLARFAGQNGKCHPRQATLAREIGVTDRQVRTYLKELEDQRFIKTIQKGLRRPNEYEFLWHPLFNGAVRKDTSGQDRNKCSAQERKEPSAPITRESKEESPSKESQPSSSSVVQRSNAPPPTPSPACQSRPERPETNSSIESIDDEPKSETAELIDLIRESTGVHPDRRLIRDVTEGLELRRISVCDFLKDISPRLKRLKHRPGPGFFLHHVKAWRDAQLADEPAPLANSAGTRCPSCRGVGKSAEGYCTCPMGRDLGRVERRSALERAQSEAAAQTAPPPSTPASVQGVKQETKSTVWADPTPDCSA